MRLKPKRYEYKRDRRGKRLGLSGGEERYGFLAEEVEAVLPELVREERHALPAVVAGPAADGEGRPVEAEVLEPAEAVTYKALNYTDLIPLLVRAVQEQQQEIKRQRGRIAVLEARLKARKR